MKIVHAACTNKAFSNGSRPLAHLKLRPLDAVNDNNALFSPPRSCLTFHSSRAAYGRARLIMAVLAAVAVISTLPLLQSLAVPIMTAREEKPKVLRGSPIAPALLQPQANS